MHLCILVFQKPKATFSLIMGVAMAVIGSSFQYGYNIAVVNAPADVRSYIYTAFVSNIQYMVYTYLNVNHDC